MVRRRRIADPGLADRVVELASRLGYSGDPAWFPNDRGARIPNHRHSLQQAFDDIGIVGCFGFLTLDVRSSARLTPILYVATAADAGDADDVHMMVWSQGVVALLLIVTPDGLQVRDATRFERKATHVPFGWEALAPGKELPVAVARLSAERIRGSLAWKDFSPDQAGRVDTRLMQAIVALSASIRSRSERLRDSPQVINALIGRLIYLFTLVDRGVIDQAWLDRVAAKHRWTGPRLDLSNGGGQPEWGPSRLWDMLDALDAALNGTVFPIAKASRAFFDRATLHALWRVIRNGATLEGGGRKGEFLQLSFLDISFLTIRTETISAMYELFLKLEDATGQSMSGAYYTPPFLADFVLDELQGMVPFDAASRVLDPASGSGVFLVGAFRRIVEATAPPGGWSIEDLPRLKALLAECIHGCDTNGQAVNVARFSLYATLLDYARGATLSDIEAALDGDQLFPKLEKNVVCRDYLAPGQVAGHADRSFTHVVGNAPWGKATAGGAASSYLAELTKGRLPVDYSRMEEIFAWKALTESSLPDGGVALLMSTKCFVNAGAANFPPALADAATIVGIANFSHFRYRLFTNARSPATALFIRNRQASDIEPVWVYAPLLSNQPVSVTGTPWSVNAGRDSVTYVRHADLRGSSQARGRKGSAKAAAANAWTRALLLQPFDHRNARDVVDRAGAEGATLGRFLERSGMFVSRGGSPNQTSLGEGMILSGKHNHPRYYRKVLGLDTGRDLLAVEPRTSSYAINARMVAKLPPPFNRLFAGDVLAVPRSMAHFDVIDRPAAFNSSVNLIAFRSADSTDRATRAWACSLLRDYLRSDLADYLFALVGSSWLLDGRRFEKGDLEAMPFPFHDLDDARHAAADGGYGFTDRLVAKLRLRRSLSDAVEDYVTFRREYQDAQTPKDALSSPDEGMCGLYFDALLEEVRGAFGARSRVELRDRGQEAGEFERFSLSIGLASAAAGSGKASRRRGDEAVHPARPSGFVDRCFVQYDPAASRVDVLKPWTIAAWTLDRAYADAIRIVDEIARS